MELKGDKELKELKGDKGLDLSFCERVNARCVTRSQRRAKDRSPKKINVLRCKAWLRTRLSSAHASGPLELATGNWQLKLPTTEFFNPTAH